METEKTRDLIHEMGVTAFNSYKRSKMHIKNPGIFKAWKDPSSLCEFLVGVGQMGDLLLNRQEKGLMGIGVPSPENIGFLLMINYSEKGCDVCKGKFMPYETFIFRMILNGQTTYNPSNSWHMQGVYHMLHKVSKDNISMVHVDRNCEVWRRMRGVL